jgi:hypothetical protein
MLGCSAWEVRYLNDATRQATQDEVLQAFGNPSAKRQLDSGESIWSYQHKTNFYIFPAACRLYELRFDPQQVLQEWKYLACKESRIHEAPSLIQP